LAEHLRIGGSDFEPLIAEIAAEPASEIEAARLELAGAVRQTRMKLLKSELDQLVTSGLSPEEISQRYRQITMEQEELRRQAEAEIAQR
jgi:DNA primase